MRVLDEAEHVFVLSMHTLKKRCDRTEHWPYSYFCSKSKLSLRRHTTAQVTLVQVAIGDYTLEIGNFPHLLRRK